MTQLLLIPRITINDVKNAAARKKLDTRALVGQVFPLIQKFVQPHDSPDLTLVRALVQVPLAEQAKDWSELLQPYRTAGVAHGWMDLIEKLRVRNVPGSSFIGFDWPACGADYIEDRSSKGVPTGYRYVPHGEGSVRLVDTRYRTMHVSIETEWKVTGGPHGRNELKDRTGEGAGGIEDLEPLVDMIKRHVRLTVGGESFLQEWGNRGAMAVLSATMNVALEHHLGMHGNCGLAFAYSRFFTNIFGPNRYDREKPRSTKPCYVRDFSLARRILERDHPRAIHVSGPNPDSSETFRPLYVLGERNGNLFPLF